ncbi:MAG: hypothetical protein WEB13_06430 [Dehalococcoidia bacterium]
MLALSTGVAGFEVLAHRDRASAGELRIIPSKRPAQLLVQAMRRADHAASSSVAAARSLVAPRTASAQLPEPAQVEALASLRQTFEPSEPPVRARAQELRLAPPALAAGDRVAVSLSFYYCEEGPADFPTGDGGGFCGLMRDGSAVYPGAAACASVYLGQVFRIIGDPTERVYKCADTGSLIDGQHRDIWFRTNDAGWRWQQLVGPTATIEILP